MAAPRHLGLSQMLLAAALFGAGGLRAQDEDQLRQRRAGRAVTFLELPDKSRAAAMTLRSMGRHAVPALIRGLNHPRDELAWEVFHLLRVLGAEAKAAVPKLEQLVEKGGDRGEAAAWALQRIRPPSRLILVNRECVEERDMKGGLLRKTEQIGGMYRAEALPGDLLLVTRYGSKLVEIRDWKGKVRWKHKCQGHVYQAQWLPGGRVLICQNRDSKEVIEVDRAGKILFRATGTWPNGIERQPGGSTLISDSQGGRVFEVDRRGKLIWERKLPSAMTCHRDNQGRTYVGCQSPSALRVFSIKGKELKRFPQEVSALRVVRVLTEGARSWLVTKKDLICVDAAGKRVFELNLPAMRSLDLR